MIANEKRLIDANALIDKFWQEECRTQTRRDFVAMVNYAPTVDAVEVVHGRWEETLVPGGYVQKASRLRKKCSVCGWTNACRYRYCPNCGAKMDGGDENGC